MTATPPELRRVLITGTSSGIGAELFKRYLAQGIEVIAVNRRDPTGEASAKARFYRLDICDADAVLALLRGLEAENLLPDVFILNAGINKPDNVDRFDFRTYQEVMDIDLRGTMTFLGAAAALGLKGRSFVGLSSTSNIIANPGNLGYYLSKCAVKSAFDVMRKADPANRYKTVILGPVHTSIMRYSAPLTGLKKAIFDALAVSAGEAAVAIMRFVPSPRATLYFTLRSVLFYYLMRAVLLVFPGLYGGSRKRAG
jgi:NAD(P)-dependent dehydrogenase (short-subunit alcohol dehydrogenase family)